MSSDELLGAHLLRHVFKPKGRNVILVMQTQQLLGLLMWWAKVRQRVESPVKFRLRLGEPESLQHGYHTAGCHVKHNVWSRTAFSLFDCGTEAHNAAACLASTDPATVVNK